MYYVFINKRRKKMKKFLLAIIVFILLLNVFISPHNYLKRPSSTQPKNEEKKEKKEVKKRIEMEKMKKFVITVNKKFNKDAEVLIIVLTNKNIIIDSSKNFDTKFLLLSIAIKETNVRNVVSKHGDYGYFQIKYSTVKSIQKIKEFSLPKVTEKEFLNSPEIQIKYVICLLYYFIKKYDLNITKENDLKVLLAMYNAGERRFKNSFSMNYAGDIISYYKMLKI